LLAVTGFVLSDHPLASKTAQDFVVVTIGVASLTMLIAGAFAGAATVRTLEWANPDEYDKVKGRSIDKGAARAELTAALQALWQVSQAADWKVARMRVAGNFYVGSLVWIFALAVELVVALLR
jgi:hypothetical protein